MLLRHKPKGLFELTPFCSPSPRFQRDLRLNKRGGQGVSSKDVILSKLIRHFPLSKTMTTKLEMTQIFGKKVKFEWAR